MQQPCSGLAAGIQKYHFQLRAPCGNPGIAYCISVLLHACVVSFAAAIRKLRPVCGCLSMRGRFLSLPSRGPAPLPRLSVFLLLHCLLLPLDQVHKHGGTARVSAAQMVRHPLSGSVWNFPQESIRGMRVGRWSVHIPTRYALVLTELLIACC